MQLRPTALLAVIAEAEPVVGQWRWRFDSSAAMGVPAHVTVLYPFLACRDIDEAVSASLRALIGAHPSFAVVFSRCARFGDEVLYLEPDPAAPFRALTAAVTGRWPQCRPYDGQFADVIPHLTVADRQPPHLLAEAEAAVRQQLPVRSRVAAVELYAFDGKAWTSRDSYSLG